MPTAEAPSKSEAQTAGASQGQHPVLSTNTALSGSRVIAVAAGAAGIGALFGPEGAAVGALVGLVFALVASYREHGS